MRSEMNSRAGDKDYLSLSRLDSRNGKIPTSRSVNSKAEQKKIAKASRNDSDNLIRHDLKLSLSKLSNKRFSTSQNKNFIEFEVGKDNRSELDYSKTNVDLKKYYKNPIDNN
jgi:hypothetical protein